MILCLFLVIAIANAQTTRFPGAIDNDTSLFIVADNIQSPLNAAMGISDTAVVVQNGTGFVPNMVASICDSSTSTGKCTSLEHMLITAVSGNILTVTRGFGGTTAKAHTSGRPVSVLIDAMHQKVLKDSVIAIETLLGPNGVNVQPSPFVIAGTYKFSAYSCNSSSVCTPGGASGMALISGNNTLTMTPVPLGVNGSNTNHRLYVSGGTGAAESCTITGGAGTSGQASGPIILNCANAHSGAWTVQSATSGAQEGFAAAGANAKVYVLPGAPADFGPLTIPATGTLIDWRRTAGSTGQAATVDNLWRSGAADGRAYIASIYGTGVRVGHIFSSTGEAGVTGESFGLAGYHRMDTATTPGVGLYGICEAHVNNSVCFGSNIVAASPPGVTNPKLVGLEIDVEPSIGTIPSNQSGALFLNAFNAAIPGPAIFISGVTNGTFNNGIGIGSIASTGAALYMNGIGGPMSSFINTTQGTFTSDAIILGNNQGVIFNNASGGTFARVYNDTSGLLRIQPGSSGIVGIRDTGDLANTGTIALYKVQFTGFAFSTIGTVLTLNGQTGFCSDCVVAATCAAGGSGAFAKRLNNINVCN